MTTAIEPHVQRRWVNHLGLRVVTTTLPNGGVSTHLECPSGVPHNHVHRASDVPWGTREHDLWDAKTRVFIAGTSEVEFVTEGLVERLGWDAIFTRAALIEREVASI